MSNPTYRFIIHHGNAVEGETIGDPFSDPWVVVRPKNTTKHVSIQMAWVTQIESYSAVSLEEDVYEQT